jgi:hypothetical protein
MDNKDFVDVDDDFMINQIKDDATWTIEHEEILVEWSDKAMCYGRLHSKSNLYFSYLNQWFTIPVIIMSILTGVGNFAFQKYDQNIQTIAINAIGGVNILSGIISTIGQSLKISELNEAHRVSSISWDKFYRNVKVELSKHPDERMSPIHMLKIFKEEFDRLMETSPPIKQEIIKEFKEIFTNIKDIEKIDQYKRLKKPEICDELISTNDFRHKWYKEIEASDSYNQNLAATKKRKMIEEKEVQFINFKDQFYQLNNRYPNEQESIDNLKDKIELKYLKNFIEKHSIINFDTLA